MAAIYERRPLMLEFSEAFIDAMEDSYFSQQAVRPLLWYLRCYLMGGEL